MLIQETMLRAAVKDGYRKTNYSPEYLATLHSARWRYVRKQALIRAGYRCESCGRYGRDGRGLDGHHWRGYEMLGNEQAGDIKMLCRWCHNRAHGRGYMTSTAYLGGTGPELNSQAALALIILAIIPVSMLLLYILGSR